ncbi:hypothetical protein DRO26_00450 [Candidatus Bathyarchaeota archaeon]|nr:MAG: hypothetical protein DRO26_00450 [Candidatus Bathyarchaeota archaeon]
MNNAYRLRYFSPFLDKIFRPIKSNGVKVGMEKNKNLQLQVNLDDGRLTFKGKDWVLIQPAFFQALNEGMEQTFGSGAGIICMVAGKNAGKTLVKLNGQTQLNTEKTVLNFLNKLFTEMGWGKTILKKYSKSRKEAIVRIKNSLMVRGIKSSTPKCYLIAGCLAGIFTMLFGEEVNCIETSCGARGDPYCEFVIRGK